MPPEISVIVSNFNGARYLPKLLETLHAQVEVQLEIIVVDRHSTDASADILARHPSIKVIQEPPESGLVAGYHAGFAHARHEHLFFCNEDMWFEPDCLKILAGLIDLPNRVAAVMPVQWTYDGGQVVNCGAWFENSAWCRSNPYPFRISHWHLVARTSPVSGINAGACLIHRQAYEEIGGWDGSFFLDYEDMDLSIRLWQHGWKCLVTPEARVYHAVGASNSQVISGGRQRVSRKRCIQGSANVPAIAIKSFTGLAVFLPFIALIERALRNLLRMRLQQAWWDLLVFVAVLRRLPDLLEYRRRHQRLNHERPGQDFFTEPAFDLGVIATNRATPFVANYE